MTLCSLTVRLCCLLAAALLVAGTLLHAQVSNAADLSVMPSLIPHPSSLKPRHGEFVVNEKTRIVLLNPPAELREVAEGLAGRLRGATGYGLPLRRQEKKEVRANAIVLQLLRTRSIPREGYRVVVTRNGVLIAGSSPAGVFHGVQTLYQLLPAAIESDTPAAGVHWGIPCVVVNDAPRFSWRGMHLDVGRHFFPVDFIKKYIDQLAMYKMNTFHWHLTEDQGWRIEIKRYPRLTEIGSLRRETMGNGTPHGGFYTQGQIREVVEYARKRFITVVPEIEMPGHSLAALASYPELGCTGGPFEVGTTWGIFEDVYCAGSEKTFEFLQDVLTETAALFPGAFVHIGGDEVPKTRWKNCPQCQSRIKSESLKDEHELQSYFIRRIEKFLHARGKRLVGWDEILEGGLAPRATVMSWRGVKGGIEAARSRHDVVMTPTSHCYFDYYQARFDEPLAIGGYLPIDTVYAFEPVPADLTRTEARHVLGTQGNMWTEFMPDSRQVEYMLAPRLCAMSEVAWSAREKRSFPDFLRRLEDHFDRLALRDVNFRVPPPVGIGGRGVITGDTVLAMFNPVTSGSVHFTIDGEDPTAASPLYTSPLTINGDAVLKARTLLRSGRMSNVVTATIGLVDPAVNGLEYRVFEGVWNRLPDFNALVPVASGLAYDASLSAFPHRSEGFAVEFAGYLRIDREGEYTFLTRSDDGSRLFIDDRLVVDNDSLHREREVAGKVSLTAGRHAIRLQYFNARGRQSLAVLIEGPQIRRQIIPARLYTRLP